MASRSTVAKALVTFSLAGLGGDVSAERIAVYVTALDGVTDAQLLAATDALLKSHKGEFIPTAAALRAAALPPTRIDVVTVRRQIVEAVGYNPHGFQPPRVECVRARFGDAIADAYATVGVRFFDGGTTGQIAERDFAKELEAIVAERGAGALLPPAPTAPPRLTSGEESTAIEAPAVEPFEWRAALKGAFTFPAPDLTRIEEAAEAGDPLAAKYLARKRKAVA